MNGSPPALTGIGHRGGLWKSRPTGTAPRRSRTSSAVSSPVPNVKTIDARRGERPRRHRGGGCWRQLVAELQQARLTGVRFKVPAETMSAKLANLPEGVSVARGRIEVRFDGAENALERLFALAQALGNDYVRFEELVGR